MIARIILMHNDVEGEGSKGGHVVGHFPGGEAKYGRPHDEGRDKEPPAHLKKFKPTDTDKQAKTQARWEVLMLAKSPEDRDVFEQARERKLVVPPAWTGVWINPDKNADLQVKGKDTKGRTQYMYSVSARNKADALKFNWLKSFSADLPKISKAIERDMGKSPEAQVLYLISKTGFRVGGGGDTGAEKQAYGASTLLGEHVKVSGSKTTFSFVGKKGVDQLHTIDDPQIAKMVGGKKGRLFDTDAGKVRAYLNSISGGGHYKVKDFRTYVATSLALQEAAKVVPPYPKTEKEKAARIMDVAKVVAARLGNSPVMARDSYIDPAVFSRWGVAA